jgi:hypothetical protein
MPVQLQPYSCAMHDTLQHGLDTHARLLNVACIQHCVCMLHPGLYMLDTPLHPPAPLLCSSPLCSCPHRATRAAAASALAGLASVLEGRDAVRRCGALRPLTLLLKEGPVSRAAAQAARAIANAAASDVIKVG